MLLVILGEIHASDSIYVNLNHPREIDPSHPLSHFRESRHGCAKLWKIVNQQPALAVDVMTHRSVSDGEPAGESNICWRPWAIDVIGVER